MTVNQLIRYASPVQRDGAGVVRYISKAGEIDNTFTEMNRRKITSEIFERAPRNIYSYKRRESRSAYEPYQVGEILDLQWDVGPVVNET